MPCNTHHFRLLWLCGLITATELANGLIAPHLATARSPPKITGEKVSLARDLPYFRWYTKDARSDLRYSTFTLAELGLFHRAIDCSWDNDGLPAEDTAIGRALGLTMAELRKLWPVVREAFYLAEDGKFRNRRQETERAEAIRLSKARSKAGSEGGKRSAKVKQSYTFAKARAYESESESEVLGFKGDSQGDFERWWKMWSAVRGSAYADRACRMWLSVWSPEVDPALTACTQSYLAGLENPAKGFNPDNFLQVQSKTSFQARWPAFVEKRGRDGTAELMNFMEERIQRGEAPL